MIEVDGTRQQYRRNFKAIYKCEGCGATRGYVGYDDFNFHNNVVPNVACDACGESTNSLGLKPVDKTVIPEGVVV